jgi:hypothetical protein
MVTTIVLCAQILLGQIKLLVGVREGTEALEVDLLGGLLNP